MGFDAGDSNLYRYARNCGTMEGDPSGMDPGRLVYGPGGLPTRTSVANSWNLYEYPQNFDPLAPNDPFQYTNPYSPTWEIHPRLGHNNRGFNGPALGVRIKGTPTNGLVNVGSNTWGTLAIKHQSLGVRKNEKGDEQWNTINEITFTPNAKTVNATQVCFVQIFRVLNLNGQVARGFYNAAQKASMDAGGWSIDVEDDGQVVWYGFPGNGAEPNASVVVGNSKTNAVMKDTPGGGIEAGDFVMQYESFVIAKAGPQAGQVYGGVSWGILVKNKAISFTPDCLLRGITTEFLDAVDLWNEQAGPQFKGVKNDPNQQALTLDLLDPMQPVQNGP